MGDVGQLSAIQIVGDLLQLAMYLVAGDLRGLRAHSRGMGIIYNALSLIILLSLFFLAPAIGRALLTRIDSWQHWSQPIQHLAAGSFTTSQLFMSAAMRSCPAFLMASVRFDPGGNFLAFASASDALATNRDYRYCRASVSHQDPGGESSSPESQPLTLDSIGSLETISV